MFNLIRSNGIIRRWVVKNDICPCGYDCKGVIAFGMMFDIWCLFIWVGDSDAIETWVYETSHHVVAIEGKLTAAYARIPISSNDSEYLMCQMLPFTCTWYWVKAN